MLRTRLMKSTLVLCVLALTLACGGDEAADSRGGGGKGTGGGRPGSGFGGGQERAAAVPVEVAAVERRDLASFIETNGTLEAESEVDIVARSGGPIVLLQAEETQRVRKGQLLARLDQDEIRARMEVARVAKNEAETSFARAESLQRANLISSEEFEQAKAAVESARAEFLGNEILMSYTDIRAPFGGLIVERYVKFAETVAANQPLFRLSDFDPLLCNIQVPERELSRLAEGQPAYLTVDAWPGERFEAEVLRLSPVIDAATGTVKVTLEVEGAGKLRPGMFSSVFLQTDTREGALVISKAALALDSIGDAVFVAEGSTAKRRDVVLGVREGNFVEVMSGLAEGELVVSVGQDSLADGTPIEILDATGARTPAPGSAESGPESAGRGSGAPPGSGRGEMTPERREAIKQRMRDRGLSDEEIDQRIEQMRPSSAGSSAGSSPGPPAGSTEGSSEPSSESAEVSTTPEGGAEADG